MSTPGIIEITAVEYYSNEHEDDVENGLVGALIAKPIDPNLELEEKEDIIIGETFIKPKKEYIYYIKDNAAGDWYFSNDKLPIKKEIVEKDGRPAINIKWTSPYSGQFDIWFGDDFGPLFDYKKTIVVESLF